MRMIGPRMSFSIHALVRSLFSRARAGRHVAQQVITPVRVAVITPYCGEETAVLRRCHDSVARQTHPCTHVMVADGLPDDAVTGWAVDHIVLPRSHGDFGSAARLIGAYYAIGLGFDAIAFLDADNWYHAEHIGTLVDLQVRTGAAFLCSSRELISLDGSSLGPCHLTDPESFIDTSCMMFVRTSFHLLHHWCLIPPYGHLIGDQIMLQYISKSGVSRAFSPHRGVYYSCRKEGIYRLLGKPTPFGAEANPDYKSAKARWVADGNPPVGSSENPSVARELLDTIRLRRR